MSYLSRIVVPAPWQGLLLQVANTRVSVGDLIDFMKPLTPVLSKFFFGGGLGGGTFFLLLRMGLALPLFVPLSLTPAWPILSI
jgi:hypothetical protein